MPTLYHSTSARAASAILAKGFRNSRLGDIACGVFLSDRPLTHADGVARRADVVIAVEAPADAALADLEIIEDDRPPEAYREWIVPAEIVNRWRRWVFEDD